MAKLRRVVEFDVGKADAVEAALADLKKFCASGVPEGAARLMLEFEAPSLEATRRKRGDSDDDGETDDQRPRVAKAG